MLLDITRTLSPGISVFPGDVPVSITTQLRLRDGASCNLTSLTMTAHAGTHVDGEAHYADGAPGVDAVPLDVLIGPARVVSPPRGEWITLDAARALPLEGVTRLLVHTRASDLPDDRWDGGFQAFTPEAADFLGAAGVRLIGTDCPSVDPATAKALSAHHAFHRRGVFIVENVLLRGVPDGDYELIVLPLKIAGNDGAPARAVLRA